MYFIVAISLMKKVSQDKQNHAICKMQGNSTGYLIWMFREGGNKGGNEKLEVGFSYKR